MSKGIRQAVSELVAGKVAELGYELVDVSFEKEGPNHVLTVYIDAPDGVTLDDCEKTSLAVEPLIDEADPIGHSYYLSVSSVGLDRPLKTDRDYARNIGKRITLKLFAPVGGKKEFTGELISFDGGAVEIAAKDGPARFAVKDIALAKPYIDFK